MGLVEGRTIDHPTLCDFRTRFHGELKDLFRQMFPAELSDLKKRQERLRKAFEAAHQGDAKRVKRRRKVALRMKTESGNKTYARRAHLADTPNGFIKEVLGLRQLRLRGLDKVRTEWLWACTAFHIRKLMIAMEKLRAAGSLEPV